MPITDFSNLRAEREVLMRECESLMTRNAEGPVCTDRERFDQNVERVEAIDAVIKGTANQAQRALVIDGLVTRQAPRTESYVDVLADTRHAGVLPDLALMAEGLAARLGGPAASEAARPYRSMRVPDLARHLLEQRGISTRGLGDASIVTRALAGHGTGDFPALLTESGNRLLRQGYEAYTGGLTRIARQVTAPDFRAINRLQLGEAPALKKVLEHGEITRGTMAESKESYKLSTFARIFGLSRAAIINDDLGAFAQFAQRQGRAAAELIASELVTLLTSNPTMNDTKALFHADHKNIGTAAAIAIASLGGALKLMRLQTGLDGKTPIDATPKFLTVPAALEVVARQNVALINATKAVDVNPFSAELEVVVDPRLDADSATRWYLAADPNVIDGLEYAFLDEAPGPQFETREGFDILGVEMRVILDFGAGVIDHRGLVKNDGV